jgi:DNA replication protein DnaC
MVAGLCCLRDRQLTLRMKSLVAGGLPIDHWYEIVGNPTLADAILDRIIHNAHRIELHGETLRKPQAGGSAVP